MGLSPYQCPSKKSSPKVALSLSTMHLSEVFQSNAETEKNLAHFQVGCCVGIFSFSSLLPFRLMCVKEMCFAMERGERERREGERKREEREREERAFGCST